MGFVYHSNNRMFGFLKHWIAVTCKPARGRTICSFTFLFLIITSGLKAQTNPSTYSSGKAIPPHWIFDGTTDDVEGMGVADYSQFNPKKSWQEALENAVNDLNANHSLIVSYYGYKIGRGPLRIRSNFAIRTFLDTTQVTVLDSARWKGRAFLRVKPTTAITDSILYPKGKFHTVGQSSADTTKYEGGQWLLSTGSTPSIHSNWYMSVTKAKQDALRRLAEDLSIKVKTETYSIGQTSRSYYNFSTLYAFQRIRVLKREFGTDSVKVQIAVNPNEVKTLME